MLLIYTPKITNRHRYIFNVFFNEIYQLDYQVTDDIEFYSSYNSGKINYSKSPISDNEFFIESHSLLDEKGINEQLIEVSVFDELPIFFQTSSSSSLPFDVFAASFYLITRYEEYLPHIKDEYGRFRASESLAFNSNFLEKPLVNIWAKYLFSELKRIFPFIDFTKSEFRFISTIDIDAAYKFKHKGFVRTCANILRYCYNRKIDMLSFMLLVFFGRRKENSIK